MEYILAFVIYGLIPLFFLISLYGHIRIRMDIKSGKLSPDWKGKLEKRFRWSKFRFEWGRVCYVTNCMGETRHAWWEWEYK